MLALLLLMALLYSLQSLFCRIYTDAQQGGGAIQFAVFYSAFAGICTMAANGFAYAPSGVTLALGLVNAMVLLVYNIAMLKCGTLGSYAFMMICVLSGGILVPMVYDALYLGFVFSPLQLFAIALILAAFVVMNLDGVGEKKNPRYLLLCALLFAVNGLYGVIMNLQQNMMQFTQRSEMIITTFLGMAILTGAYEMLFARKSFMEGYRMPRRAVLPMLLSALSATLAVNLLMYLMKSVNLTLLSVIDNGGVMVLSAIYAFVIFKEKPNAKTVLGILMACVSVILLSL